MLGQYYQVGTERYVKPYEALRASVASGHFSEYVIPHSTLVDYTNIDPATLPSNHELTKHKAQMLLKNYDCVLHYTGGTDSQTIIEAADFSNLYIYLRGIKNSAYIDEEYWPGVEYAEQRGFNLFKRQFTEKTFEVWFDKETPYKYADFFPGFSPGWYDYLEPWDDKMHVYGWDKPTLYCKDGQYYWVLRDDQDWLRTMTHCDFYLDNIVPELAVKQVYTMKQYFSAKYPTLEGWVEYKHGDILAVNRVLGRVIPPSYKVTKTHAEWHANSMINYKHKRSIRELRSLGRDDIVQAWINTMDKCVEELVNGLYTIDVRQVMVDDITVRIPERIIRIGAIFKLHPEGLELLPHKDISKL